MNRPRLKGQNHAISHYHHHAGCQPAWWWRQARRLPPRTVLKTHHPHFLQTRTHPLAVLRLQAAYEKLCRRGCLITCRSQNICLPCRHLYPSFLLPDSTNGFYVRNSLYRQPAFDYSSYTFNGGDNITRPIKSWAVEWPGLTGLKLSSIRNPSRTILAAEVNALAPWSWHDPQPRDFPRDPLTYNDAKTMVSFVDGHVSYIRIFWDTTLFEAKGPSFAMNYNPPPTYDYQWSGD